jgi:hypothetical protein
MQKNNVEKQNWVPHFSPFLREVGTTDAESAMLAHITGFPNHGYMKIALTLDDRLLKDVRKIAVERDTTLTGLILDYLQSIASQHAASGRKRRERETPERSFTQFQFRVGKKTWKREDLCARHPSPEGAA